MFGRQHMTQSKTMTKHRRQYGMTLIELMVALSIGAFLMIGAITVFVQSRTTFRITESLSRLQENARFALDSLEPDIRMAHYWGMNPRTSQINGRRPPTAPAGPGPNTCGNNWTIDLDMAVAGSNNSYTWGCAGLAPVETTSDTLVIRRASEDPQLPTTANSLSILTVRNGQPLGPQLFMGTTIPAGYDATLSATHRLIVNGYYVSRSSTVAGTPSLRVKTLQANGTIADQEVLAGVENMQIEFGVDTDLPGEPADPSPNRGSIDRWVNPDDPIITRGNPAFMGDAEILAVRVWLRVRAERLEPGFTDNAVYVYADQNVGPIGDGFRRILVSKTIYLRNARPAY
jgi:type IV pilus assembly protein PilW